MPDVAPDVPPDVPPDASRDRGDPSVRETAGVPLPPPLLPLGVVVLAALCARFIRPLPLPVARAASLVLGAALTFVALTLAGRAVRAMRARRTPVEPWKPTRALLTDGVFARSRNPIYLAFLLLQGAWAVATRDAWPLLLLPLSVVLLWRVVIRREERYLTRRFGEAYAQYRARTPRWWG